MHVLDKDNLYEEIYDSNCFHHAHSAYHISVPKNKSWMTYFTNSSHCYWVRYFSSIRIIETYDILIWIPICLIFFCYFMKFYCRQTDRADCFVFHSILIQVGSIIIKSLHIKVKTYVIYGTLLYVSGGIQFNGGLGISFGITSVSLLSCVITGLPLIYKSRDSGKYFGFIQIWFVVISRIREL